MGEDEEDEDEDDDTTRRRREQGGDSVKFVKFFGIKSHIFCNILVIMGLNLAFFALDLA